MCFGSAASSMAQAARSASVVVRQLIASTPGLLVLFRAYFRKNNLVTSCLSTESSRCSLAKDVYRTREASPECLRDAEPHYVYY